MKLFWSYFFFSLFSIYSFSQVNTYFDHHPVWQVTSQCAAPLPCLQIESKNYYTQSDTVINALVYKQIFKKGEGYYFYWGGPPPPDCVGTYSYTNTFPSYFLRSFGKRIFLRQPTDTTEYLLYDFDLNIGDTLPVTFNNPQPDVYVSGIDSVNTNYGYLKRFQLSGNNSAQYLIEGIGSSNGLIEPIPLWLECSWELNCFSLNDTSCYPSTGLSCNLSVGVNSADELNGLSISPNPFHQSANLILPIEFSSCELIIYNTMGKKVSVQQYEKANGQLHREGMPNGLYFFISQNVKGKIVTGKFVVE